MIREQDLHEAIAECQGKRNPDANTCIKLAAYLTILNSLYPKDGAKPVPDTPVQVQAQSFAADPDTIQWEGDSDFARVICGRAVSHIMPIMEELMETVQVLQPRLYDATMRRLKEN